MFLIYSTQAAVLRYCLLFLTMTALPVASDSRISQCSAHDRISEKFNLKVCCFESSKQKKKRHAKKRNLTFIFRRLFAWRIFVLSLGVLSLTRRFATK